MTFVLCSVYNDIIVFDLYYSYYDVSVPVLTPLSCMNWELSKEIP